jgi:transposase
VSPTAAVPPLNPEQRTEALRKARAVRSKRRAFKDRVTAGDQAIGAAIALARSDEALSGIKTLDLLQSLPGIGPRTAEAIMAEVGIAPSRRLRGLGEHQVALLIERLSA